MSLRPSPRWPGATYRVQLHAGFTFDDVAEIAPYLVDLGVTHVYLSPFLQAAPGSTHGYDVVDPRRLNPELGGDEAYERMTKVLRDLGLRQIADIVPNHMALAGRANALWWDVLENGPASRWAHFFDIDWTPPEEKLHATVLMPILGDHYGRVLDAGELSLRRDGGSFAVRYYEHELPVSPRSLDTLLREAADASGSDELATLASSFGRLPHAAAATAEEAVERHRDKEVLRRVLARLLDDDDAVRAAVDAAVERWSTDTELLHALCERQNWRIAFWRTAAHELDYRRFFDVTTLVAVRMEDPEVFAATHELVLNLLCDGHLDGLRIDHPDGLRDPAGYLDRLRARAGDAYVVVEKILEPGEKLPPWPVQGTTGYDYLNRVNGLFVDGRAEGPLTDLYNRFTGEQRSYEDMAVSARHEVMRTVLAADIERLTALLVDVAQGHRRHRDYTRPELRDVLREAIASFPVYRTYVRPGHEPHHEDERRVVEALASMSVRRPDIDSQLIEFLGDVLLLRHDGPAERELALRFQQVSSAVMAKGVEDTTFYRYHRLVSLNEVGGDPARFGVSVDEFHHANVAAAREWPATMLSTSTHDTKRAEDTRVRIAALSEMPDEWEAAVWRWAHQNDHYRSGGAVDRATEYLIYQVLVGAYPLPEDRAVAYVEKAIREAKVHTSWIDQQSGYEDAVRTFVRGVTNDPSFRDELARFAEPVARIGRVSSLAQTLLKLTSPGVPDVYQGTELWDLSLVDPDNRRAVDYDHRRRLLDDVRDATADHIDGARWDSGAVKLWVTARALRIRRELPAALGPEGSYEPVEANGEAAEHVVAYVRGGDVAVVVPRLVHGLGQRGGFGDTVVELPHGRWLDVLTGSEIDGGHALAAQVLGGFPVALLRRVHS